MTQARTFVFRFKKLSLAATALGFGGLCSASDANVRTSYNIPVFTQQLAIEGGPDKVEIAPVFGDKDWAFTARWDDNNANSLNMHAAMAELGLRGTFYLNAPRGEYQEEFAQKLSQDGSSVGGHTSTHYFLPTLNANALFEEILLNRIQREADADTPINSFAFPYGRYQEPRDPQAIARITEAWVRSGYHHNVYEGFVLNNPYMPEGYASTGNQVVPGDRQVDAEKFRATMDKILSNPAEYKKKAPTISLGVHAWQSPGEMEKFKELLSEYAGRNDFWYVNQTELAAYRFQAVRTQITPDPGQDGQYTVMRPCSGITGGDIPLTLRLSGPRPKKVLLDGEPLEIYPGPQADTWLVHLPYPPEQAVPTKIDWTSNGPGFKDNEHTADKFPAITASLEPTVDGLWKLRIANDSKVPLTEVYVTFRLPLSYEDGIRTGDGFFTIAPGTSPSFDIKATDLSDTPALADGPLFAAAEIDFLMGGESCRLYAVYSGEVDTAPVADTRDSVAVVGPFGPKTFSPESLLPFSQPGAALTPVDGSPLGRWHTCAASQRELFGQDRVVLISPDSDWKNAAKGFSRKPAVFAAVGDIKMRAAGPLTIASGFPVIFTAVDGEQVKLSGGQTPSLTAGQHRVLFVFDTEGKHAFSREYPQVLRLTVEGQPVTWLPAPAIE